VTRSPAAGSALLAGLTGAAAAGGPVFGAVLDRRRRPERVLAVIPSAYALGITAIQVSVGHLALPLTVGIAMAAGVFNPAVADGWTSQLPSIVTGDELSHWSALDALTFGAASLTGPALAAVIAAWSGARAAVMTAAALVALAIPAACSLSRSTLPARHKVPDTLHRQLAAGFGAIFTRPALRRATATSVVSYAGIGMLVVCCPVLGQHRLGAPARGALLISAMAAVSLTANALLARRPVRGQQDTVIFASTVALCVSMTAAAVAPGWVTVLAVASAGAGEGPQLTAVFAVRHREAPAGTRGQIFTTAASLKIGGLAAGAALAGPLADRSVTACLLVAATIELCAAATYLITGVKGRGGPSSAPTAAGDERRVGDAAGVGREQVE
jgi:predicted MFS family arabinose efflux permease